MKKVNEILILDRSDFGGNAIHPRMFDEICEQLGLTDCGECGEHKDVESIRIRITEAGVEE